jgi:hypothetical protein
LETQIIAILLWLPLVVLPLYDIFFRSPPPESPKKRKKKRKNAPQRGVKPNTCAWGSEWDFNYGLPRTLLLNALLQIFAWTDYFGQNNFIPRWLALGPLANSTDVFLGYSFVLLGLGLAKNFKKSARNANVSNQDESELSNPSPGAFSVCCSCNLQCGGKNLLIFFRLYFLACISGMIGISVQQTLGWKGTISFYDGILTVVVAAFIYRHLRVLLQMLDIGINSSTTTEVQEVILQYTRKHESRVIKLLLSVSTIVVVACIAWGVGSMRQWNVHDPLFDCCNDPDLPIYTEVQELTWNSYITVIILRIFCCYNFYLIYSWGRALRAFHEGQVRKLQKIELRRRRELGPQQGWERFGGRIDRAKIWANRNT